MSDIKEVEKVAENEFSKATQYGFSEPKFRRYSSNTTINWFYKSISFELQLDWREFIALTYLVRLENGHLPEGYYVSNGKKCRIHLLDVISEKKWPVDPILLDRLKSFIQGMNYEDRGKDTIIREIKLEGEVFFNCIEYIIRDIEIIFGD